MGRGSANDLPPDAASPRVDRILSTHSWLAVPDPKLRSLDLPIAHCNITIALMGSPLGDYAAYVGLGAAEWVAQHGSKLTFEQARSFFPLIEEGLYRA